MSVKSLKRRDDGGPGRIIRPKSEMRLIDHLYSLLEVGLGSRPAEPATDQTARQTVEGLLCTPTVYTRYHTICSAFYFWKNVLWNGWRGGNGWWEPQS